MRITIHSRQPVGGTASLRTLRGFLPPTVVAASRFSPPLGLLFGIPGAGNRTPDLSRAVCLWNTRAPMCRQSPVVLKDIERPRSTRKSPGDFRRSGLKKVALIEEFVELRLVADGCFPRNVAFICDRPFVFGLTPTGISPSVGVFVFTHLALGRKNIRVASGP